MSSIRASLYLKHFNKEYSPEILEFANKLFPDYIFTWREGKQQYGYCTACKNEFKTEGLHHKYIVICPKCKEEVTVQSSGISRTRMINQVYFIYYEKSAVDPEAIVARGIYGVEDFTVKDFKSVEPKLIDKTLYVFKIGESVMLSRYTYYDEIQRKMHAAGWDNFETSTTIYSELHTWQLYNQTRGISAYSIDSIERAVEGTPFQYSCWQSYNDEGAVKFFDLFSKYPRTVEYLTKLGFKRLIEAKLTGAPTYGAVNWKGKTVFKMLRINRADLKLLRNSGISVDSPLFLRLYQMNKKDKKGYTIQELKEVEKVLTYVYPRDIPLLTKYSTLRKTFNYLKKQYEKGNDLNVRRHFYSLSDTLVNYRDYLRDCMTLEMDLKNERVLFPKDLYTAHQITIAQVKVKENEKLEFSFKVRYETLSKKYRFEYGGLIIRPVKSVRELIEEGKALHHCVGTYAERHASGYCSIFLIRKATDPDQPYYTLELFGDRIIQTRGMNNCSTTPEIDEFLKVWTEEKIFQKKKGQKVKITVPA